MKNNDIDKRQGVCSAKNTPYERNNYFYGKLMTIKDYEAEQKYYNEKRWLINRMVNGTGVVKGLAVSIVDNQVQVKPGMAIDNCGREIVVCSEVTKDIQWDDFDKDINQFVICIKHHECKTAPLEIPPIVCDTKEERQFDRIRDSFEIVAQPYVEDLEKKDPICQLDDKEERSKPLYNYICEKLSADESTGAQECGCVPLATVTRTVNDENEFIIKLDEDSICSGIRPLVFNNPLLYDLIHCFHKDMPHVVEIGWEHGKNHPLEFMDGKDICITFDKEVKNINNDTFIVDAIIFEESTGYQYTKHIPGTVVQDDKTYTFTPKADWITDNIKGSSILKNHGGKIVVTLKSDFIVDSNNNAALDGNFIGGKLPSGNGVQGGDFVSWFDVNPKPKEVIIQQEGK